MSPRYESFLRLLIRHVVISSVWIIPTLVVPLSVFGKPRIIPFVEGGRGGIKYAGRGDPFWDPACLSIGIGCIIVIMVGARVNGVRGW
jgi:hypothetical protein